METSRRVDIKAMVSHIVQGDGTDKCRICMGDTSEGQVYLGDTVMVDENKSVTLAELLLTVTGIEMEEENSLPRGLCRACSENTLAAAQFQNLCTESLKHWHEAATYLSQDYEHYPMKRKNTCIIFYNGQSTTFKNIDEPLDQDALNTIDNNDMEDMLENPPMKKVPCKCPNCKKRFRMPYCLNIHLKSTTKRACYHCGLVVSKSNLVKHMKKAHGTIMYNCANCMSIFGNIKHLERHWVEIHTNQLFCKICNYGFNKERALIAHQYMHNYYDCKACRRSFDNRQCYMHHKKQCGDATEPAFGVYTCDYCGVSYERKPSLKIHIYQKHINVLPYSCSTCGKRASTLAHLASHELTHKIASERKIYECHCGAKLRTELGYRLHQRIHSGEKPFECGHCGERFLSSSRRLDHMKRKHINRQDLPYACDKCTSRFVRPCELKKHILVTHKCADVY